MIKFAQLAALVESFARKSAAYTQLNREQQNGSALATNELDMAFNDASHAMKAMLAAEAEILADPSIISIPQPVVRVYYEPGYRWTVLVEGEDESRAVGVTKEVAVRQAKAVAKEIGGKLDIEVLSGNWRSEIMKDRWDYEASMGYTELRGY